MSSVFTKILGNLHFASGSLRFKGPVRNLRRKHRDDSIQLGGLETGARTVEHSGFTVVSLRNTVRSCYLLLYNFPHKQL